MTKNERKIKELTALFILGGAVYSLVELLWRGRTHASMALAGGICFCGLYKVRAYAERCGVIVGAVIGAVFITAVELAFGCVCNLILGLGVWDYSERFCNLAGQICLMYTLLWFLICFPAFMLCNVTKKYIFDRW